MSQGQYAALTELMSLTLTPQVPNGTTTDADGFEVLAFAAQPPHSGYVPRKAAAGRDTPTRYVSIGGIERPVLSGGLSIPATEPRPQAGEQRGLAWEYVVTAIGPNDDPELLNARYMVVGSPRVTATARRLDVVEVD